MISATEVRALGRSSSDPRRRWEGVRFNRRRTAGADESDGSDGFAATLALACDGDSEAIGELYRELAPLVLGYLRSNRVESPEDVTSDVFVSVMDAIETFEGNREQFRSWVLTIAYRRRVDELRRRGRRHEDSGLPPDLIERGTEAGDVETTAIARLRVGGVIAAMNLLTEEQQSVLMLRVLADLPIKDICRITGKTEAAVKALLRRSFASLARNLAEDEVGNVDAGRIGTPPRGDC